MKRAERKKIKSNEFIDSVTKAQAALAEHQRQVMIGAVAILVILVIGGGFAAWRSSRNAKASALLASALTVAEAPVVAPPPPAPGSAPPIQQPGTYRTEMERAQAALPLLTQAADAYPNTSAGITARFQAAATLASLGRDAEAEQRYQDVIDKAGRNSIYGRTARLGLGETQLADGKTDQAITTFQELSTDGGSDLPLDGVLMQLGRAYVQAGKKEDAARAFTRIVQEFPDSPYSTDAKDQLAAVKKVA
ncbi:MAG: tetratricopeptide repeat protein [Vicinamibacterales bacterium]